MGKETINVGLIGFGTIGAGVVKILQDNAGIIRERLGSELRLTRIADKDIETDRGVTAGKAVAFSTDAGDIINDSDIDIVVELIGGYEPARSFVMAALEKGKRVVTANKALLAVHGAEIFEKAADSGSDIGFEASVGGGIPVIRAIKEGLSANNLGTIDAIINGTANYILTEMTNKGGDFQTVLKRAQELGYAEADPTFDIEGVDSAHKLAILASLAFGTKVVFEDIHTEGISDISKMDIDYATELGYKIKLLAIAKNSDGEIEARVNATMIPKGALLSNVEGVLNAVYVTGDAIGPTMYYGPGAGMMPTASAVVGDIIELSRDIINGISGRVPPLGYKILKDLKMKDIGEVISKYYLRFSIVDSPGVLSKISGILGAHNISISSVLQKGRHEEKAVPLVIITHEAQEKNLRHALTEIDKLDVVMDSTKVIRIEEKLS
ncbi:MAG: homoserine dehydrogenase [Deltaproteobacteria bacterium]|nr:homoserine dehydrogenase [Deltaproteobacteria bacterium]